MEHGVDVRLSGWGRFPVVAARIFSPRNVAQLRSLVLSSPNVIARGSGRAYGDSAINPSATVDMRHFNKMLAFDGAHGQLIVDSGVTFHDVIAAFLPRGWFPTVTPGTKFVSIGGAIAADVHGKNHHKDGSFRECVDWIELMGPDGEIRRCSKQEHSDLFDHTLGGMGLTGIIVRAAIRLRPVETAWIRQRIIPAPNLRSAIELFDEVRDATYSVAWIDCLAGGRSLGRSLILLGEHAVLTDLRRREAQSPLKIEAKRRFTIPFDMPASALNRYTVQGFNALYYLRGSRMAGVQLVDWDSYFYPLDSINGWNRVYGRSGFAQFQCVFPLDQSSAGLSLLLTEISRSGSGSFLAVLKRFGRQQGVFSFPLEGYTLALDFPVNRKNLVLLERLDEIVIGHGGRFYLAKDSRMTAATLRIADPRTKDFHSWRVRRGFASRFKSAQSERLNL